MNFLKKYGLIALALAAVIGGLVRYGAIAGSVPKPSAAVHVENVESMNLSVCNKDALSASTEGQTDEVLGGLVHNIQETFDDGIAVDGTEIITGTGAFKFGSGTAVDKHLHTSATINPDNLVTLGASTSSVITVTGAALGDTVILTRPPIWMQTTSTAMIAGYVSAADTVTVQYWNVSSSAVDLGSGSLQIDTWSHQ